MAGGGSPRQKMINLMYLVFIAMLALNMSKQVLSAFGYMKEKLTDSNERVTEANVNILENLAAKAEESPGRYATKYGSAKQIKAKSDAFCKYLGSIQDTLIKDVEDPNDYESMDKEEMGDTYFFSKDEKFSEQGQAFVDKINGFREDIFNIIGDSLSPSLKEQIQKRFSTPEQPIKGGKVMQPWLVNRYKGFPLITTLTNLKLIQADIRTTEGEIYNSLLGEALIDETNMNNYKAIVALDKTAYFSGEEVTGSIVLGKYDNSMVFDDYSVNVAHNIDAGQVKLKFNAGNPGEHDIKGYFGFKQKDGAPIRLEFDSKFSVITEPNDAVISADKMNVVYRGLQNPLSISVPGVGDSNVKVNAPGLDKVGPGKYMMEPQSGSEVTIKVNATLSSGKPINTTKIFRIKDVPAPMGALRGQTGRTGMPKESLQKVAVEVVLNDFVYDLKFAVTGFSVKVPGQATVVVNGARMDSRAQSAIAKARRGDQVNIFDIKSKIIGQGSGLRVKDAGAILVEIK